LEREYIIQHKLKQARNFESEGKYLHSIQIYHSLINQYPDFIHAYLNLAVLYERQDKPGSAEEILKQVIAISPYDNEIRIYFAQFLIRNMKFSESLEVLKKVDTEEEPLSSFLIGVSYLFLREYELAKMNLLNFVISDEQPEFITDAYFLLANIELKLMQYDNALKFAHRAETILSNFWGLHLLYAKIYFELEMFTHSIEPLQKVITMTKDNPLVDYCAGKIFLRLKDYDKSEFHFNRYLDHINESCEEDYTNKMAEFFKSGKIKDALINSELSDRYNEKKKLVDEIKNSPLNQTLKSVVPDE